MLQIFVKGGLGSDPRLFLLAVACSEPGRADATLNPVTKKMASAGIEMGQAVFLPGQVIFALGRAVFVPDQAVFKLGRAVFLPGQAISRLS